MLEKYFFPSCNWCHQNCIRLLCFKINHVVPQIGHDVDHFTSPEGVPGVPETNFNNRPNSFKVLSPPRTCVVMFTYQLLLNWTDELEAIHHSAIPATDKTFATRLTTVWMKRLRQLVLERLLQKSLMSMQPPSKHLQLLQKRVRKENRQRMFLARREGSLGVSRPIKVRNDAISPWSGLDWLLAPL